MSQANHTCAKATFLLLGMMFSAATAGAFQVEDEQLARLQNEIARAIVARDLVTLERLYAPEFSFITGAGEVKTREQVLAETRHGIVRFSELEYFDLTATRYSDTGVVVGQGRGVYSVAGERFENSVRFTRVHVLRDGIWQVVLYQVTRLPLPPANAPPHATSVTEPLEVSCLQWPARLRR